MREERGLSGATTIIGMGDYLEIWNTSAWQSEQAQIDDAYAELLQDLADAIDASKGHDGSEESR